MLIPDTLRQEHMPMMAYALCRAVKANDYTEDELIKDLSATNIAKDEKSREQAGKVLNFCRSAGFVTVKNERVTSGFSEDELVSPKAFAFALLRKIDIEKSEKYKEVLKWFLWKGPDVEAIDNHKDVRKEMLEDSRLKQLNITEDYTHGFLFWTEFLGIATHSIGSMGAYNYSIENILIEYIRKNRDLLRSRGNIPMQEFLEILSKDLFFVTMCYEKTEICYSLSFALRVIEKLDVVDLEDKNDGSMTWHLEKSNSFKVGNSFTNIKVR